MQELEISVVQKLLKQDSQRGADAECDRNFVFTS